MKKLKQYVELIVQFKVKPQEIEAVIGNESTKTRQFFNGLVKKIYKDEEHAVHLLYGEEATTTHGAYRVLKNDLKKRLVKLVSMIDFKQADLLNDLQQAFYSTLQNLTTFKILQGRAMRIASADLAETILEVGLKYEIADAVVVASDSLRAYYTFHEYNEKKYIYYRDLSRAYLEVMMAEHKAHEAHDDIQRHYLMNKSMKKWLHPIAVQYVKELSVYKDNVTSYRFLLSYGYIEMLSHVIINDYKAAYEVIERHIDLLKNKPFEHKVGLALFYTQKLECCLALRLYEEGHEAFLESRRLVMKNSHNWFNNTLLGIQFYIYVQDYEKAWEIYLEGLNDEYYKLYTESKLEEFGVYEAYLNWLVSMKKYKPKAHLIKESKQFKLSRFLNEVIILSKDKAGMNISIVLLQILFLISEKRYDEFVTRLDALDKYRKRYTKDDENIRTKLFVKLIRSIPDCNYNKRRIVAKNEKILEQLNNTIYEMSSPMVNIEIMPYEHAWAFVLETL